MKVLFLNPIGTLGGAEQVLLDLIASLRRASPELELDVLALEDGPLLAEAAVLGATTDVLPLPTVLATLGESGGELQVGRRWVQNARAAAALGLWTPRFAALLRRKRADILHSNGLKTHLLAALAKPRAVPLIWHLHDFISERRLTARLLPLLQRRAALSIAVSQAVADDAHTVLRRQRIETVLNGIRTELFAPGKATPLDLDALAGLGPAPNGTVRVGLVATYASWKGHDLFLEAARQVRSPAARFYIVGGAVYSTRGSQIVETELREAIRRLDLTDRCGLVPFQADPAGVYAALDVVVQASTRAEPFGRTVAEAMASGKAVLAPSAGGILEQLPPAMHEFTFPPGNTTELVTGLTRLIGDGKLRTSLGAEGRAHATKHLDFVRVGTAMMGVYGNLMGASRLVRDHQRMDGGPPGERSRSV